MRESFRDRKIADDFLGSSMACRTCRTQADHETLRNLGGLCHPCFEHYCEPAPSRGPAMTIQQKRTLIDRLRGVMRPQLDPGSVCADALRARREREVRMGHAQIAQLAALEAIGK